MEEREAREDLRDHDPKPYVRERAAAFLLTASGVPPAAMARNARCVLAILKLSLSG
jgi:hypothetical protein